MKKGQAGMGCLSLLLLGCWQRDNPFDPANALSNGKILTITSVTELNNGTRVAKAGDTLRIQSGIFPVSLRFAGNGTIAKPIVVEGRSDMTTVLNSQGRDGILFLSGNHDIEFRNLVFQNSAESGAKLESGAKGIIFRKCRFVGSSLLGVESLDSQVEIHDCEVKGNSKGIRAAGSPLIGGTILLNNVLVVNNTGLGVEAVGISMDIRNSTIADNRGHAVSFSGNGKTLALRSSIFAWNQGFGALLVGFSSVASPLTLSNSDFFGNDSGEVIGNPGDSLSRFRLDPRFKNRTLGDFSLEAGSTLDIWETEGNRIGYRPY